MSELIERRVRLFNKVREMPYRINTVDESEDLSCHTKSRRLQNALWTEFHIESRIACTRFLWSALPLPSEYHRLSGRTGTVHVFLEALIPETGKWTRLDPIWDSSLRKGGFIITEWDGINPTELGIPPEKEYDEEQSARAIALLERSLKRPAGAAPGVNPFERLNQWLESVRNKPEAFVHA